MARSLLLPLLLLGVAIPPNSPVEAKNFVFQSRNRTYSDLTPEALPIRKGPMTIRLSSPSQALLLRRHAVELTRRADGTHDALLEIEFTGGGTLVADIDVRGAMSRLEDQVLIPLQTKLVQAQVALRRSESGFVATVLERPDTITVEIRSKLAGDVVVLCRTTLLFRLLGLNCRVLEEALSAAEIPLPPVGEELFVADAELTTQEIEALESYLDPERSP